jgi:hypothetical protein
VENYGTEVVIFNRLAGGGLSKKGFLIKSGRTVGAYAVGYSGAVEAL